MFEKLNEFINVIFISRQFEHIKTFIFFVINKVSKNTRLSKNFSKKQNFQIVCCLNCAKYYNFFSNFVCYKSFNSNAKCLLCIIIRKNSCVTIKIRFKLFLIVLQNVVQIYISVSSLETF